MKKLGMDKKKAFKSECLPEGFIMGVHNLQLDTQKLVLRLQ